MEQPDGEKIISEMFTDIHISPYSVVLTVILFNGNRERASPFCRGAGCKGQGSCSGGLWVALRGDPLWSSKVVVRDPW